MYETLIIDTDPVHAGKLIQELKSRRLRLKVIPNVDEATRRLRNQSYQLVILNVSDSSQPWLQVLDRLREATRHPGGDSRPLFLCISNRPREPRFQLEVERQGARYVYER